LFRLWHRERHQDRWKGCLPVAERELDTRDQPVAGTVYGGPAIQSLHRYDLPVSEPGPHPAARVKTAERILLIREPDGHALDSRAKPRQGIDEALLYSLAQCATSWRSDRAHFDPYRLARWLMAAPPLESL
jgi:hypothetical protein